MTAKSEASEPSKLEKILNKLVRESIEADREGKLCEPIYLQQKALKEIREIVIPSERELKNILFMLYPMSYGDDGECQLSPDAGVLGYIDGNKIVAAIRADMIGRVNGKV